MKHNLSNRPSIYTDIAPYSEEMIKKVLQSNVELAKWCKEFEKELQEILRCCQASKFPWKEKADFIREVLGEEK